MGNRQPEPEIWVMTTDMLNSLNNEDIEMLKKVEADIKSEKNWDKCGSLVACYDYNVSKIKFHISVKARLLSHAIQYHMICESIERAMIDHYSDPEASDGMKLQSESRYIDDTETITHTKGEGAFVSLCEGIKIHYQIRKGWIELLQTGYAKMGDENTLFMLEGGKVPFDEGTVVIPTEFVRGKFK